MEKKHLVLASGSPRRKELLSQLGYEFSVLVTDDNNAILKALYYDEMTDESYETIKLRSFDDQGTKYDNRLLNEEHGELALVRQFIGTKILPSFKNQENILELKRKLIDNLLIAIESQMRERIATKQFKISPLINNQALIEELKLFYPKLSY